MCIYINMCIYIYIYVYTHKIIVRINHNHTSRHRPSTSRPRRPGLRAVQGGGEVARAPGMIYCIYIAVDQIILYHYSMCMCIYIYIYTYIYIYIYICCLRLRRPKPPSWRLEVIAIPKSKDPKGLVFCVEVRCYISCVNTAFVLGFWDHLLDRRMLIFSRRGAAPARRSGRHPSPRPRRRAALQTCCRFPFQLLWYLDMGFETLEFRCCELNLRELA